MVIKCNNIFYSKALQILPKLGFLVRKQTIWQPWSKAIINRRGKSRRCAAEIFVTEHKKREDVAFEFLAGRSEVIADNKKMSQDQLSSRPEFAFLASKTICSIHDKGIRATASSSSSAFVSNVVNCVFKFKLLSFKLF
jgi:hypothetical protein